MAFCLVYGPLWSMKGWLTKRNSEVLPTWKRNLKFRLSEFDSKLQTLKFLGVLTFEIAAFSTIFETYPVVEISNDINIFLKSITVR